MEGEESRRKFNGKSCWGFTIGGLILLGAILAMVWFLTPLGKPVPTVSLIQPAQNLALQSGDTVILIARGESRNGIEGFDFLVDGQVVEGRASDDPRQRSVDAVFSWSSTRPGVHKLSVIAQNTTGKTSDPAEVIVVVNPNTIGLRNIEQDPVESDADSGSEEITADQDQGIELVEGWREGVDQADVDIFLAELDAGPDGNFPIENPVFGDDLIPEITSFEITAERSGEGATVSYSVLASDDFGLNFISVTLVNMNDPVNPVAVEYDTCGGANQCSSSGILTITQGGWYVSAQAMDTSGQSSIVSTRQVQILEGDDPPAIAEDLEAGQLVLDPNMDFGEIEHIEAPLDDIGEPWVKEYVCEGQVIYLAIPYTYLSDHGDEVYVGATAENGNILVAAGHEAIGPGTGIAYVEMEAIAEDLVDQTDELNVYLRVGDNYFYEETVQLDIHWPTPQPDLVITNVLQSEAIVSVDVKNMGCAPADGYDLQYVTADGESFVEHVDYYLAQDITHRNEVFIDPNRFSLGFEVIADPGNTISEINEENNTFSLGPITIKYIEFYKINILDVSEGFGRGDTGEFFFIIELFDDGFRDYAFPPDFINRYYAMSKGEHSLTTTAADGSIQPFRVTPVLAPDQSLKVEFLAEEDDRPGGGIDDLGTAALLLSPDFLNDNCWKKSGEFQIDSDRGFYSVYLRIILNER